MRRIIVDLETQSDCNLPKCGGFVYAEACKLICVAWCEYGGSDFHLWYPEASGLPQHLIDLHLQGIQLHFGGPSPIPTDAEWCGHNSWSFDEPVWASLRPLSEQPRYGWSDSQLLCAAAGLPQKLDLVGKRLFGEGKFKEGSNALKEANKSMKPIGDGNLAMIGKYNVQDVRLQGWVLEECEACLHLTETEKEVMRVHRLINARGVKLDTGLITKIHRLTNESIDYAVLEIAKLTEGKLASLDDLNKRDKVIRWMESVGISCPKTYSDKKKKLVASLKRDIIDRWIDGAEKELDALEESESLSDDDDEGEDATALVTNLPLVIKVLKLRQSAKRITGAKLAAAGLGLNRDGRARGLYAYWGAGPGRFAGRRIQTQNLPTPVLGNLFWEIVDKQFDYASVKAAMGNLRDWYCLTDPEAECEATVDDTAAGLIRGIFVPDKYLLAADLAAIEARVLGWYANQEWLMEAFWKGTDPYLEFAYKVTGVRYSKKAKERKFWKATLLGCIAEGSPVRTDRGWVKIEEVRATDRVWDGVDFVSHDGVVFKGTKETICVNSVWMTPDHEVLTAQGWSRADHASSKKLPLGHFSEDGRYSVSNGVVEGQSAPSRLNASVGESGNQRRATYDGVSQLGVTPVRRFLQAKRRPSILTSAPTLSCGNGYSIGSVRSSEGANEILTPGMVLGGFGFTPRGSKIVGSFSSTYSASQGTTDPSLRSTEEIMTGDTFRGTCGSLQSKRMRATRVGIRESGIEVGSGRSRNSLESSYHSTTATVPCVSALKKESIQRDSLETRIVRVYDILNAGPRSRFQVGGLIAHNCGFQLGETRFGVYMAGQGIDLAAYGITAHSAVDGWRDANPKIAGEVVNIWEGKKVRRNGLWQNWDAAALEACRHGGPVTESRVTFYHQRGHLYVVLPSGREIIFRNAKIATVPYYGKTREAVVYVNNRGMSITMFGGKWTENIVQATARDIMVEMLIECERQGLTPVLHVHDEIGCDTELENLPLFRKIMTRIPTWADGLPVDSEGSYLPRYSKSPPPPRKDEEWRCPRLT